MKNTIVLIVILIFSLHNLVFSQDITQIKNTFDKKNAFKISGGASASLMYYSTDGEQARKQPYTYMFAGNLLFSVYTIKIPFTYSFSNQKSTFKRPELQPFNRYGISPYYKWIKLFLGRSTMEFSELSMNRSFFGTGIELSPGILRFTAMYGKIQDAAQYDSGKVQIPTYKRMAYTIKTGVCKNNDFLYLILFKAKDISSSVNYIPDSVNLTPGENLVLSVNANKLLFDHLQIFGQWSNSLYSKDISSNNSFVEGKGFYKHTDFLLKNRLESNNKTAYKTGINFLGKFYSIGLQYERTDPNFANMGLYYILDDQEIISATASLQLFKGKLGLSSNIGKQRNNLDNSKASNAGNNVYSFNVVCNPISKLNVNFSYSNFLSYALVRTNFENINDVLDYNNIDTLDFKQISKSITSNITYQMGDPKSKTLKHSIMMNMQFQSASGKQGNSNFNNDMQNTNASFGYMANIVPVNAMINIIMNANYTTGLTNTKTIGPTISATKMYLNKTLRLTVSESYNKTSSDSSAISSVNAVRFISSYSLKKKHNFTFSIIMLHKLNYMDENKSFHELTGTLAYAYRF